MSCGGRFWAGETGIGFGDWVTASDRRYGPMLAAINRDHLGLSRFYYLDISMQESLRRHATRPQAADFGRAARVL